MSRLKLFALIALAVLVTSGGCGNSPSGIISSYVPEDANAEWTGAWTAPSGTASVHAESFDYRVSIQSITATFTNCSVDESKGSAKMTALLVFSGDIYIPMFFKDLTLSTDRTSPNSWTAQTPHGNLSITLTDNGRADFSGSIDYLGYDCEFSASVNKLTQTDSSINIADVLDGTWNYDAASSGGYRYANGEMSLLIPDYITVCFNDTTSTSTTLTTAGLIFMPIITSGDHYDLDNAMSFQFVNTEAPCTITRIYGDNYDLTDGNSEAGIDSVLFVQSPTQIYMLMNWIRTDGQLCILLPLTKAEDDGSIIESLSGKWTAKSGGGLMIPSENTSMRLNLTLESCDLTFSDVRVSNGKGTAMISLDGVFSSERVTLDLSEYNGVAVELEELGVTLWRAVTEKGSKFYVSMLDDGTACVIANIVDDGADACILTAVFSAAE